MTVPRPMLRLVREGIVWEVCVGAVLFNLPSPLMTFFKHNVIDIHHILTFQTSGDTWPESRRMQNSVQM